MEDRISFRVYHKAIFHTGFNEILFVSIVRVLDFPLGFQIALIIWDAQTLTGHYYATGMDGPGLGPPEPEKARPPSPSPSPILAWSGGPG